MSTQAFAGVVAIVGGVIIAVLAFVPMAAVTYRRRGQLTRRDLANLLVSAVYGLSLWTYTLLPLPASDDFECREAITRPSQVLDIIRAHPHHTLLDLARNPMVMQIALNVALFVPLGVLLRVRARRGVFTAALVGLAMSLAIEVTQHTGLWGIYDCAYRYFDISDLISNPTGAVVGSVLAAMVAGRRPAPLPRVTPRLTRGRRVVALVSDLLVVALLGSLTVVLWRAWQFLGITETSPLIAQRQALIQWGLPLAVQTISVVGWGTTIGERVVQVRTQTHRRTWALPARLIELSTGVGALAVLGAGVIPGSGWLLLGLTTAHLAAVAMPGGRGLSNTLARLDLVLDSTTGPSAEGSASTPAAS